MQGEIVHEYLDNKKYIVKTKYTILKEYNNQNKLFGIVHILSQTVNSNLKIKDIDFYDEIAIFQDGNTIKWSILNSEKSFHLHYLYFEDGNNLKKWQIKN